MLRIKNKLTVLHDDNGAFIDHSSAAIDYDRDSFSMALDQSQDYLYVGFYKPINVFYVELETANTNSGTLTGEYWNGTAWTSLEGFFDETASLERSGFMQWDRNQVDEEAVTVDSKELFWYRFRPSVTHSTTTFKGLNIVFADDQDLKKENFEVSEKLPSGESSHILTHVAARDEIIQWLRNNGHSKKDFNTGKLKDITAFDLLDLGQIKLAATYLAMSKILFAVSDEPGDIFQEKSREYRSLYKQAIKTFFLDIDNDDDGIQDTAEKLASNTVYMVRR